MVEIFDDIRKIYRFVAPCEELADYVEFFSESSPEETAREFPSMSFMVKMFPSWTPTIWINLGTPYSIDMGSYCYEVPANRDVLVLRNNIVIRHNLPSDKIFTIKFFPGGLQAFFNIDQTACINKVLNAADIIPSRLINTLKEQACLEGRIKILQDFLCASLARQKASDHYLQLMQESIGLYTASNMHYNTSELAEKLFLSSKTINRYFHRAVGTNPKKYFSILRARTALTVYAADKKKFEPSHYGYYDMSHFYRQARQFSGQRMPLGN